MDQVYSPGRGDTGLPFVENLLVHGGPHVSLLAMANRDGIGRTSEPGKAILQLAVPGGGQASLVVERELALRLARRRLQAGTTLAGMVRAGDPDLVQLLLVRIAEQRAEHQAIDLDLARLAPAATLEPMAARRDPDLVVLEQGGTYRLSPSSDRARTWLAANAKGAKRDGAVVLVTRREAMQMIGAMRGAGMRVAGVF